MRWIHFCFSFYFSTEEYLGFREFPTTPSDFYFRMKLIFSLLSLMDLPDEDCFIAHDGSEATLI